jgi:hypothetical protein
MPLSYSFFLAGWYSKKNMCAGKEATNVCFTYWIDLCFFVLVNPTANKCPFSLVHHQSLG